MYTEDPSYRRNKRHQHQGSEVTAPLISSRCYFSQGRNSSFSLQAGDLDCNFSAIHCAYPSTCICLLSMPGVITWDPGRSVHTFVSSLFQSVFPQSQLRMNPYTVPCSLSIGPPEPDQNQYIQFGSGISTDLFFCLGICVNPLSPL